MKVQRLIRRSPWGSVFAAAGVLFASACGPSGSDDLSVVETLSAQLRSGGGDLGGDRRPDGHRHVQRPPRRPRSATGAAGAGEQAHINTFGALPADEACNPSHMALSGGQPMHGDTTANIVTVVPVIWGTGAQLGWTETQMDGFLSTLMNGVTPWYTWQKHEYRLPNISTKPTKRLTVTAANASKTLVSPDDIRAEIIAHLQDGTLPTSTANHTPESMLYVVNLPSSVSTWSGNTENQACGGVDGTHISSQGFCAYNYNSNSFTFAGGTIHYIVQPDITRGGCVSICQVPKTTDGRAMTGWENMTMVLSHELAEALSDPVGGWYDSAPGTDCGQVADPCANIGVDTFVGTNRVTAQLIWSNKANMCVGNSVGAAGDLGYLGTSAVVLAGDTDPGTSTTAIHYAQGNPGGSITEVITAKDLTVPAAWMPAQKTGRVVLGDFDGNNHTDIAAVGVSGTELQVVNVYGGFATNAGNARFFTSVLDMPELAPRIGKDFLTYATQTSMRPVAGDFNGDAATDIALLGGPGWTVVPIAFGAVANPDSFWATAEPDNGLNSYIANNVGPTKPQLVSADFNGDGLADLALVGLTSAAGVGRSFIVVGYSIPDPANRFRGYGSFRKVEVPVTPSSGGAAGDFNAWAATANVTAVAGDFDGDGFGDIALSGAAGWATVPMAFSRGASGASPSFSVVNMTGGDNATIAAKASAAGAQVAAGDFDGNGITDLAVAGGAGWNFVGLAMSPNVVGSGQSFGNLYWDQNTLASFATTAAKPSVYAIAGTLGSPKPPIKVNAGDNGAQPPFIADAFFTGGSPRTRANTIDLSGVVEPAPAAVYQSQRFGSSFSYTFTGYTAGSSHKIRLHFCETNPVNNAVGKRKFNVAINGTTQLSNLDIFATTGALNKALVKEFILPADTNGKYVLSFSVVTDAATVSGIEIR